MVSKPIYSEIDVIDFYNSFSADWWKNEGTAKFIHSTCDVIYPYTKNHIIQHLHRFKGSVNVNQPFEGLNILDIGCGGGILSEKMAKDGASVTGIDINLQLINVAKEHSLLDATITNKLSYFAEPIENYAEKSFEKYDVIVIQYVLPHVRDKDIFLQNSLKCLKSKGLCFLTTISNTWASWLYYKLLLHRIGGVFPNVFSDVANYTTPDDLHAILRKCGCDIKEIQGLYYNFLKDYYIWCNSTSLDYVAIAIKN